LADTEQSYAKHTQRVPLYLVTLALLFATLVGAGVNLYESLGNSARLYSASLLVTLSIGTFLIASYARTFALRAQDRAIRAEEQLRHYVLTGKLLDPRLTLRQIIGLRFASDGEFADLARRAADQNLSQDDIKKAVKQWRADTHRV